MRCSIIGSIEKRLPHKCPPVQQRTQPSVQRTQPQAQQNQQRAQFQQRNQQSSQERMRQQAISNAQNQTRQRLRQKAFTRNLPQNSHRVPKQEIARRQETLNQFERLKQTASSPQQRAIYARAITAQKAYLNKPAPVYTHTVELKGRANIDKFVADMRAKKAQSVELQRAQTRPAVGSVVNNKGKNFAGNQNRQQRLKELVSDDKVSSANKGWIKQEINEVSAGKKGYLRNPPGKHLAHERGREANKGYGYEHAHLQNVKDHMTQHKLDNWGKRNKERPVL